MRAVLAIILILFVLFPPPSTRAQQCPDGWRPLTSTDISRAATLGLSLTTQTPCLDPTTAQILDSAATTSGDKDYLLSRVCAGRQPGFPVGFNANDDNPQNWNQIRSGYVYLSGGNASMDPGALRCFWDFFQAAEKQGMQPCITSGFRTPAHQRSSCLSPQNSTVCGRSNRGTGPVSSCPLNLSAYYGCAHVNGYALDIADQRGGSYTTKLLGLAKATGKFSKVGAGPTDPWHVEARGCISGGAPAGNVSDTWQEGRDSLSGGIRSTLEDWGFPAPADNSSLSTPAVGDVVTTQPIAQTSAPINWSALVPHTQGGGTISPQMGSMNVSPVSILPRPAPQTVTTGASAGSTSTGSSPKDLVTATPLTKPDAVSTSPNSSDARDALIAIIEGQEGKKKTTTVVSSSSPPRLTTNSENAMQLTVPTRPDQMNVNPVSLAGGQPVQTFISPDLAHSVPFSDPTSQSTLWVTLENMRITLARTLEILQPFSTRRVLVPASPEAF